MRTYLKIVVAVGLIALIAGGAFVYYSTTNRLIQIGELRIDPKSQIDPNREYHLVVWEHDFPLPWDKESHAEALQAAIDEFEKVYPNIRVDIERLEWSEGYARLRESLDQGDPPDVYGMPLGARRADTELQVPVSPYMSDESREDHLAQALRAVTFEDEIWSWPRWILPRVWVGREDLTSTLAESRTAWSFERLTQALTAVKQETGARGIAVNPYDPSLFADVMIASTGQNLIGKDGNRGWSVEFMEAGLTFFRTLIDLGLMESDADRMARTRLLQFWNKRTAVIAPVTPWMLRHILTRAGVLHLEESLPDDTEHKALALPPPAASEEHSAHPANVGGYVVFMQSEYQGDDHTKASMTLAEHLSRRLGPWEAAQLFGVPAHPTSWDAWREDAGLPEKELDLLIEWVRRAVAPPVLDTHAHQQQKAIEEIVGAEFPKLWKNVSPRDIAESIARKVDGLRAQAPSPSKLPNR